jgi:DNA-binding HxlR family transcriptional regulator
MEHTVLPETPVRVEYVPSRMERELATAVHAMMQRADTWVEPEPERVKRRKGH